MRFFAYLTSTPCIHHTHLHQSHCSAVHPRQTTWRSISSGHPPLYRHSWPVWSGQTGWICRASRALAPPRGQKGPPGSRVCLGRVVGRMPGWSLWWSERKHWEITHWYPHNMEMNFLNSISSSDCTCIRELKYHWFRKWLVAYEAPSHHLNQCWFAINVNLQNIMQ